MPPPDPVDTRSETRREIERAAAAAGMTWAQWKNVADRPDYKIFATVATCAVVHSGCTASGYHAYAGVVGLN